MFIAATKIKALPNLFVLLNKNNTDNARFHRKQCKIICSMLLLIITSMQQHYKLKLKVASKTDNFTH
jgi:hypothetical protein